MDPLTADQIRRSFVNTTKGEATRAPMPDLDRVPWDDLDFLGWVDPSGSDRAWLVVPRGDSVVGLQVRQSRPGDRRGRGKLCQICVTPHTGDGVCLTVARRVGAAGKRGDSTGLHICRDLACSLYARGRKVPSAARLRETLSTEQMVARVREQMDAFVARVLAE